MRFFIHQRSLTHPWPRAGLLRCWLHPDDNQPQRKNGKGHVDRPALLKAQLFAQGPRLVPFASVFR
jgi:hypothetical protein